MGYESKIIVVNRREIVPENGMPVWVYGDELARFDFGKMGYDRVDDKVFWEIFNTPIDFNLYMGGEFSEDEFYRIDCYGVHCKYTTLDAVIHWLTIWNKDKGYTRVAPVISYLADLKAHEDSFNNIVVVHYGY